MVILPSAPLVVVESCVNELFDELGDYVQELSMDEITEMVKERMAQRRDENKSAESFFGSAR